MFDAHADHRAFAATRHAMATVYAHTMVEYGWHDNGTDSHFMIGYRYVKHRQSHSSIMKMGGGNSLDCV